jgi:murein DD-endopeptidase MepM/ murein hydrolase activator NlpD
MKTGFGNFLGFSLVCFLAGCSSVDTTAIIENNQSIYFGKKEKYRFVKSQTVQSVSEMAQEYHVPIKEIKRLNSLDSYDNIKPGTIIKIPIGNYYLIKSNDTLESIARVNDVDLNLLAEKNGLSVDSEIFAGDYIVISESGSGFVEHDGYKHVNFDSSKVHDEENVEEVQNNNQVDGNKKQDSNLNALTAKDSYLVAPKAEKINKFFKNHYPINSEDFMWPINGRVIKTYGDHNGKFNEGINIAAEIGEPVKAASRGEVAYLGNQQGYGNLIILKHNNGYMTAYSNLDKFLVKKGQIVNKGIQIATVGNSANLDGPQLQFSIKKGNRTINPDE